MNDLSVQVNTCNEYGIMILLLDLNILNSIFFRDSRFIIRYLFLHADFPKRKN